MIFYDFPATHGGFSMVFQFMLDYQRVTISAVRSSVWKPSPAKVRRQTQLPGMTWQVYPTELWKTHHFQYIIYKQAIFRM